MIEALKLVATAPDGGYTQRSGQEKPEAMQGVETARNMGIPQSADGSNVLSLKVPYGAGALTVEIRVSGERLKRAHIERIRKYLELAEDDLDGQNGGDS